ncbi:MAG: SusC/RagA family TonB-linked outer membrane protein [Saprospiraceae bacterium]|nr:SusC/RagA family TonB-linked outer membrane protein [Saprospiraceae bacterium]
MKKLSLLLFMLLCAVSMTFAQRTVTGTITDVNGETLIGANVLAKGTSTGTITDVDGSFSLEVPDGNNTLVISYTGYQTQEVDITGQSNITITMAEGQLLDEIVVTGLGIKKDKKALGYAVTTIGSADINLKPEGDVSRILRGKVPGVDITSTSGLAGSGTNVIIRGYSSITGGNQPLFVVDGVPFNADTNSDRGFTSGGASASSRFLDLDPNSIKEVSILKGLSATVLYGESGRNGVVLVTTKGGDIGEVDKGMEVSVNQSIFATQIGGIPETQKKYGNGWQGDASNAFSNWGAPFAGTEEFATQVNGITDGSGRYQLDEAGTIVHPYSFTNFAADFPDINGTRIPWQAQDGLAQFLGETGLVNNTSLNISNKLGSNSAVNFNYGFLNDEGFIPSNKLERHNFGLGLRTALSNGITVKGTFNYTKSSRVTPPAAPIYSSNPIAGASIFSNVLYTPVSHDLYGWPNTNPVDGSSVYYRSGNDIQHPLWALDNISDDENVDRFFGNINLGYQLTDNLSLNYRFGVDNYTQTQRYAINKGGSQVPDGLLNTSQRINTIIDQNLNLIFDKSISEDWSVDGVLGINLRKDNNDYTNTSSTNQFIFGLQTHQNFSAHQGSSFETRENLIGAYITGSVGYKSFLYLTMSGRNDFTSTLESGNNSIFYPSASVSFIPTDAFASLQGNNTLNYLKFRLGYGTSAGYPDPYQTRNTLGTNANAFFTNNSIIQSNTISNTFGNPDLEPETHTEIEFGTEARLFNNRISVDLSLYSKQSRDLIIDLELDPSTGGTSSTINSASLDNKGIEVALTVSPIATNSLRWDFTTNFTRNRSEVISIADGIDKVIIDGLSFLGNFAIPGEPYGVIEGTKVLRDDASGLPIVGANGIFQQDPDQGIIGDPNPDFNMNFINTISYKSLSIRAQFDWQQGGDIWGSSASTLTARGIAGETDFDRFLPVIVNGLKAEPDGTLVPNDIQVTSNNAYWRNTGVWYDENRIFDATSVRLREVSLSYSFPKSLLDKTPFGSASLTVSGQNLWYKAVNFPESINFDPEVLSLGVGNGRGFDFVTGPTSKRYGATLSFTF